MTLQTQQLSCARAGTVLFDQLDLKVTPGEALKVSGANGAGKSSLLRILCGLTEPSSGRVMWQGRAIHRRKDALHRAICYFGHSSGLKDELTACENLRMATLLSGRPCSAEQAGQALDEMGLGDFIHTMAGHLSQGQRRRVNLARLALSPQPRLLVLDEPFNALDQPTVAQLTSLLRQHLFEGAVLVYTTHQDMPLDGLRHHELSLDRTRPAFVTTSPASPAWVRRPMGMAA